MNKIEPQHLDLNKKTLSFPQPVEQAFLHEKLPSKITFFRTGIISFCFLNLFLQYLNFGEFSLVPTLLLIPLPVMMLCLKMRNQEKRIDLFCCLSLFFTCTAVISIMVCLPNTLSHFPVLFFLTISGFVLFKVRYLFIGLTGFFLTLTFGCCLAFFTEVEPVFIFHNTFFLIAATIIGVAAAYSVEYYSRMLFLKTFVLKQTIKKNREQERERSKALIRINKSLELEIKAHREAESQLKESEEKYKNLVASLPEGVFIVQDKKIVFLNPSMETLTGCSASKMLGADTDLLFEKLVPLNEYKAYGSLDYFVRRDGQKVFIEKSIVEIQYNSKPAQLYSVRDITDKINVTRDKRKLKKELEKAKKMEAFGILAGGVAHDLNNVLSGLVTVPETILLDLPEDSEITAHMEAIKESGHKASAIAEELLTMARGSAKSMGPVNMNDVIEDYFISPEFDALMNRHPSVEIERSLEQKLPVIEASRIHIAKIVMNLFINAVEAAGEDNGKTVIETGKVTFLDQKIKGYEKNLNGKFIKLSVMNTGKSISQKDMDHIFEPFYSKKMLGRSGTGLGLSIVWNCVHDHNGYIEVNSRKNNTCFATYFPLPDNNNTTITTVDKVYTLEDYSGNGENILVVDDLQNQRKIAMNMLKRLGYRVHTVSSGEEAIKYVRRNPIDLAVLDMVMEPGLNGFETYEQLILIDPKIKAIITSGYQKSTEVEQAQRLGAGRFVQKPYSLEKLGVALKNEFSDGKITI